MVTRSTFMTSNIMSTTFRSSLSRSNSPESFWAMSSSSESFLACRSSAEAAATRSCPNPEGRSRLVMPGGPAAADHELADDGVSRDRESQAGRRRPPERLGPVLQVLELEQHLAEGDRVIGIEPAGADAGAVDAGAVGAAEILHLDPVGADRQLGVAARDGRVVDGDVAA